MIQVISGQASQHGIDIFINHVKAMLTHFDMNPFTPNTNPQKTVMFMSCVQHCHP